MNEPTDGHRLFRLLQEGKYFAATRDGVAFDYWKELPEERRAQYDRAAHAMIMAGRLLADSLREGTPEFDREATTMRPP